MDNLILIDYLSATVKVPDDVVYNSAYTNGFFFQYRLGMDSLKWEVLSGVRGFSSRLWFDGISIHLPSVKMPYLWLEMSGKGCRAFETYGFNNWFSLLKILLQDGCSIKRIDLAHDDHSGILDMPTLINDTLNEEYVSKSNKHEVVIGMDDTSHEKSCSIYHGSQKSNTLIRIYDKAKQLDLGKEHWIRTEIQLRDDNAENTAKAILSGDSIGDIFSGILVKYIRYVDEVLTDTNRWRWPIKEYWSDLVGDAQPIKIASTPGVEYNISNLENYVFNQAGNAILTYIQAFGIDKFLSTVKEYKPYITNPKYRKLLEDLISSQEKKREA